MSLYRNALSLNALCRVCSLMCMAGIGVGSLALAAPVAAQVVYDGGSPIQTNAFLSEFPGNQLSAETFTFGSPTSFNTVQWYGIYAAPFIPATDDFTIIFFDTTAGVPDFTPIAGLTFNVGNAVNRNATGLTVSGLPEFGYSSTLPGGVSLPAGTYGILIATNVNVGWHWEVADSAEGIQHFYRRSLGDAWQNQNSNLSFRLLNVAAPEPGSLALFGVGLGLAGVIARRKRSTGH